MFRLGNEKADQIFKRTMFAMPEIANEIEMIKFPKRILEEWQRIRQYYSPKSKQEVWEDFKKAWDPDFVFVKENLDVPETANTEWKFWRDNIYHGKESLEKQWEIFKTFWNLGSDETNIVFEEMSNLSTGLLREWRYKYNFKYTHVYEGYNNVDYSKSKAQMWEEFKDIWDLDMDAYDEYEYNRMIKETEGEVDDYDAWYNFRENANYHSYDSYSVRERYEIWCRFVEDGCRDPYSRR